MYFSRKQRAILFLVVSLVLLFSTIQFFDGQSYFCDGYVEEAVLIQKKISNPSSNVSLVPYKADKNITIQHLKWYLSGNMTWVRGWLWRKKEKTYMK